MKDALTGLVRATFILFGVLLVFNLCKPMIFGSVKSDEGFDTTYTEDEDFSDQGTHSSSSYDKKFDYEEMYNKYKYSNVLEVFGEEFMDYYYLDKKFDNNLYLFLSIANLTKNKFMLICNNKVELKEEDVKSKSVELFGGIGFKDSSYTTKNGNLIITFDEENNTYIVENKKCSGIKQSGEFLETKFLGGKYNDDKIEIYEQVHLVKQFTKNGVLTIDNYKGVTATSGKAESSEDYSVYKYVFARNSDTYILEKITRQY